MADAVPSTEYSSVVPSEPQNAGEVNTFSKFRSVNSPNSPDERRLSSRSRWKASTTVQRIGSTTITSTMTRVGEIRASPARASARVRPLPHGRGMARPTHGRHDGELRGVGLLGPAP